MGESRFVGGWISPDTLTAILRLEGASSTHNQKALVLARTQGQLDFLGVSSQMRRLFGSLGGRGAEDVFATIQESPASQFVGEESQSSASLARNARNLDGNDSSVSPEKKETFLPFRAAGKTFYSRTPSTVWTMGRCGLHDRCPQTMLSL